MFLKLSCLCLLATLPMATFASSYALLRLEQGSFSDFYGETHEVDAYALGQVEVTVGLWDNVWVWAQNHGYEISPGFGGEPDRPISGITWYDAVKWCNALSEKEGRTPVYYLDDSKSVIYRKGNVDIHDSQVMWSADGFRLPQQLEWEYAYRANTDTNFYWGNGMFDVWDAADADWRQYTQSWMKLKIGKPQPVAQTQPNGWGFYDMAGNVAEWCWDLYELEPEYEESDAGRISNLRVHRGGSVALDHQYYQQAYFRGRTLPAAVIQELGFRVASSDELATITTPVNQSASALVDAAREAVPLEWSEQEPGALANNFFSLIDLSHEGLEEVAHLYDEGKYVEALEAYRDFFLLRAKSYSVKNNGIAVKVLLSNEEVLALKKPTVYYDNNPSEYNEISVSFVGKQYLDAYSNSRDQALLQQYFEYTDDYIDQGFRQFHLLSDEGLGRTFEGPNFRSHWPQDWEFSEGLGAVKAGDQELAELILWGQMLDPDEFYLVPADILARRLIFHLHVRIAGALFNAKEWVPNQIKHVATSLMRYGYQLSEFKTSSSWVLFGSSRLSNMMLNEDVLEDGGDMEQSFNYNKAVVTDASQFEDFFEQIGERPDWMERVEENSLKRALLFVSLMMPQGILPCVGEGRMIEARYYTKWFNEWRLLFDNELIDEIVNALVSKNPNPLIGKPDFTSITFPYSGYTVLRNDWEPDGLYLFMKSSRIGRGHEQMDENGIQLSAYGRALIIDTGNIPYSETFLPDELKVDYMWLRNYIHNTTGTSSVLIDGVGQNHWSVDRPMGGYRTTLPHRWSSSPSFDFTEGVYDEGFGTLPECLTVEEYEKAKTMYGSDPEKYGDVTEMLEAIEKERMTPAIKLSAVHRREVIFVKSANFWIVVDRLSGDGEYFTQNWHFPPTSDEAFLTRTNFSHLAGGFEPQQIVSDSDAKVIQTIDPNGVNLSIFNFNASEIDYVHFCGDKYPYRGWSSTGMRSGWSPSPLVQASWTGSTPMVTVLYPRQVGDDDASIARLESLCDTNHSGFILETKAGETIFFMASSKPTELEFGSIQTEGDSLLVLESADSEIKGIVSHATNFMGEPAVGSFEFQMTPEGDMLTEEITIPQGFHWAESQNGDLGPVYTDVDPR